MVQLTLEERFFVVRKYYEIQILKTVRKLFAQRFLERHLLMKSVIWANVENMRQMLQVRTGTQKTNKRVH